MKSIISIVVFSLSFVFQIGASNLDSLIEVANGLPDDSSRVNALLEISAGLWQTEPEEAIKYADEAITLCKKINFPKGLALAYKNIGLAHYIKGDYTNVLDYWLQSLEAYRSNGDKPGISNLLGNIGAVYFNRGDDPNALKYFLEALRVSEEIKDTLRTATLLVNIGAVNFNKPATHGEAEENYLKALELAKAINYLDAIGTSAVNLGEIYTEKKDFSLAQKYFEEALSTLTKTGGNISYVYTNMGKSYRVQGEYSKALGYQKKALKSAEEKADKLEMALALNAIGETYFAQKNYSEALSSFLKAKNLAEELRSNTNLEDIYKNIADCYSARSDYKNANNYLQLFSDIKDTLYNDENNRQLGNLKIQFDLEKKEAEVDLLNSEKELQSVVIQQAKTVRNFLIAAAIFLLVTIGGVMYQYQFTKKTNKIITEERNKSDNLLLNILPAETADELKRHGAVKAKKYDFATVLFTDFKAFTKQVESMPPEELVKSIDFYFKAFDDIFEKNNLEKIKTIGDSYMCAGGLPIPNKTNPVDAINAGLEILQFVDELKKFKPDGIHLFNIRVGISTGPVISGVVGKTKFQYDIWGDTVNVASRMETSCEIGKVNISEFTYKHVKDHFDFEDRGNIEVKNRGKIKMYYVRGLKHEPMPV